MHTCNDFKPREKKKFPTCRHNPVRWCSACEIAYEIDQLVMSEALRPTEKDDTNGIL